MFIKGWGWGTAPAKLPQEDQAQLRRIIAAFNVDMRGKRTDHIQDEEYRGRS